jgi:hypothetical protein
MASVVSRQNEDENRREDGQTEVPAQARPAMREDERCDVTVRATGLQTGRVAP